MSTITTTEVTNPAPKPQQFPLAKIDGAALDLQQRTDGYDSAHVDDLKAAIAEATEIAPVDLYLDAETGIAYIGDGWHRYIAHHLLGKKELSANLHEGGKEAAFVASLSANAKQLAKPRRRADIRKAVKAALGKFYVSDLSKFDKLPKSKRWTMEQIAEKCATTKQTVSNVAKQLEEAAVPKPTKAGSTKDTTAPEQIDFFQQLNASFRPVEDGMKEVLNHTFFLNEKVTKEEKIEALQGIERAIKAKLQEAKDLRIKFQKQD